MRIFFHTILQLMSQLMRESHELLQNYLFEYQIEEDANEMVASYQANASSNFWCGTVALPPTGPKTAVMTSLYSSKEKADQAMAARKPLLEEVKAKIKSINIQEDEAYWLRWSVLII